MRQYIKGEHTMKVTISQKLLGGFIAVLIILAATIAISSIQIDSVDNTYTELVDDKAKKLIVIQQINAIIGKEQNSLRGYLLTGDATSLQNVSNHHQDFVAISQSLSEIIVHPQAKSLLDELIKIEDQFYAFANKEIELKQKSETDQNNIGFLERGREIIQSFDQTINELVALQQNILDSGSIETTQKVNEIKNLVFILGVIAILLGLAIARYLGWLISKPIVTIAKAAEQIAAGDLTIKEIQVKNNDEIGSLANSFNQMSHNLRELLNQIGSNSEQVAASAEQLMASTQQISSATEQIASTIQNVAMDVEKEFNHVENTTTTINEMSIGIEQIANHAQHVSEAVTVTYEKASGGGHAIQTAIEQMDSINETVNSLANTIEALGERSKQVDQIVDFISEIAEQTNLLALNAAIEAARAGEQGLGFAVVASEVRKLAEQSSSAAQQISQLITTIHSDTNTAVQSMRVVTNEVVAGISVVDTAGQSFTLIQDSIKEVTSKIHEVSSAVQQMSASSEQLVQSMQYITEVAESTSTGTQEVSTATEEQLASMEEISASASSLSEMAEELHSATERFKV